MYTRWGLGIACVWGGVRLVRMGGYVGMLLECVCVVCGVRVCLVVWICFVRCAYVWCITRDSIVHVLYYM